MGLLDPQPDPTYVKQMAFIAKLRTLSPEDQRMFIAQQLSQGVPDTSVQFQHPGVEKLDQSSIMDIIRRQRGKAQGLLNQPL